MIPYSSINTGQKKRGHLSGGHLEWVARASSPTGVTSRSSLDSLGGLTACAKQDVSRSHGSVLSFFHLPPHFVSHCWFALLRPLFFTFATHFIIPFATDRE